MSLTLTVGKRLFSTVDSTEMVIVRAPSAEVDLTIGGLQPVLAADQRPTEAPAALDGHTGGTLIGKRYIDAADTLELLCTKAGDAIPALGGVPLALKVAKPLPASD